MWALDQAYAPRAERLLAETPATLLAGLAIGAAVAVALVDLAVLPASTLRVVGVTAGHGALLATALAWAHAGVASRIVAIALLALAASASLSGTLGAAAYLAPALWIFWLANRGRLEGLSLGGPVPARAVAAGAAAGAGLSFHLLLSATRTLSVQVRADHVGATLAAIAYDVGANVLAAECFFRGVLFTRAARRWPLPAAAGISTGAYLLRYLIDPLLPKSAELVAGAVFYLALLGVINCWLLAWSRTLVPGLVSATLFFAAYRTLGPR